MIRRPGQRYNDEANLWRKLKKKVGFRQARKLVKQANLKAKDADKL